jgi:hypothetical protein
LLIDSPPCGSYQEDVKLGRVSIFSVFLFCGCFLERSIYIGGYHVRLPTQPKTKVRATEANWAPIREDLVQTMSFRPTHLNEFQEQLRPPGTNREPTVVFSANGNTYSITILAPQEDEKTALVRQHIEKILALTGQTNWIFEVAHHTFAK